MDDILAMDKKIRQVNARLPRLDSYGNILGTESKRRYSLIADVRGTRDSRVVQQTSAG